MNFYLKNDKYNLFDYGYHKIKKLFDPPYSLKIKMCNNDNNDSITIDTPSV